VTLAWTNARTVRTWCIVHKWTSLICTLFILLLCLTGLPLIFKDEIDGWLYDDTAATATDGAAPTVALDRMVEIAQQRYPGEFLQFLFWNPGQPHVVTFGLSPTPRAQTAAQLHALAIDARTGEIINEPKPRRGLTSFLLKLHTDMFLGLPGTLFLGAMGLMLIAALVSGAVVYGPFMRKLDFGAVRHGRARVVRWLDLHNLLGIVTLAWIVVVAATGSMNTLAAPLFDLWRSQALPRLLTMHQGKPLPAQLSSVDAAVALAREVSPGMRLVSVVFPHSRFTSPRHYLIWTKGISPLTAHLFAPVLIDAETGELTGILHLPWYVRTLELSRPLHFGDYGGTPLKLIWALLDIVTIVVLGSGLYLWLGRRRHFGAHARTGNGPAWHAPAAPRPAAEPYPDKPSRSTLGVFAAPLLLALVSGGGLVSALLGDGLWDTLSWLALGGLPAVIGWYVMRAK
jgi:uncharacterized iron-regulated membrane protein